jgi:hypothetical protein
MAYYVTFSGERVEYRGLRKKQAVWRYHWLDRRSRSLDICGFGWGKSKDIGKYDPPA